MANIKAKSFDLAWVSVTDMDKAKKFFVDTLGMKIVEDNAEYNWVELSGQNGGTRLGFGTCSPKEGGPLLPGQNAVISLTIDDIQAAKKSLEAQGVTIVGDIMEVPGQVKLLLIKDQDGNLINLCQKIGE
jgi:predicted enzyme related to lactoylglutathione lyase